MRKVMRMKREIGTKRVQAIIPIATAYRLMKAATRRKMSASGFIAAAIESKLNEVETPTMNAIQSVPKEAVA